MAFAGSSDAAIDNGAIASPGRPALSSFVAKASRGAIAGGAAGLGDWDMACVLERHSQRELNFARSAGTHGADRRRGVYGMYDAAEAGHAERRLRQSILGMVEDVEELGAKLQAGTLGKRDAFAQADIHLPRARSASDIAGCVAVGAGGRNDKNGEIDPLADGRASRENKQNPRHDIGPLIAN